MARNNNRLLIPIIAGLGLLALLGTLYALFGGGGAPAPNAALNAAAQAPVEQPQSTQFVAARDISPRTPLTRDLFRQAQVDASEVPSGAITELGDLNGRLANRIIRRGEVITQDATIPTVRRVIPASFPVPAGSRAIAIYVNPEQTAAGLVDVGDRVDVIATHRFAVTLGPNQRNAGASGTTTGRVIAQNLLVLAVDKSLNAPPPAPTPPAAGEAVPGAGAPPSPGGAPGAPGPPAPAAAPTPVPPPNADARVRVLLATPIEVAARLVAAQEEGKLHIAIRNPTSADQFPVPEVREYPTRIVQNPIPRAAGVGGATGAGGSGASSGGGGSSSGGSSSGGSTNRRNREPDFLAPPAPSLPSADPVPPAPVPQFPAPSGAATGNNGSGLPSGSGAPLAPPESQDNEVTVIRGTEKTRVLVPR